MKQREIWLADLNPVKGNEQKGVRPVVVISGNAMNDHLGISIVCPLTSSIKNYAGCPAIDRNPANGLSIDSQAITFQVRTLSRERFRTRLGEISGNQLREIIDGLNDILTY